MQQEFFSNLSQIILPLLWEKVVDYTCMLIDILQILVALSSPLLSLGVDILEKEADKMVEFLYQKQGSEGVGTRIGLH
jgi:hypothetical protein